MTTFASFSARLTTAIVLILFFHTEANAQFNINPGITPAQVAAALAGPGLTVANVQVNCSPLSYGSFSGGAAAGLGMGEGIVMTTGNATSLMNGPNQNDTWSNNAPTDFFPNDPDLTAAMATNTVIDGCFIEFDVVPMCDNISITFVFGSDEYNNWVNANFNDGFGFFITGPNPGGGNYNSHNVARLPNNTIVSIDNVNLNTNNAFFLNNTPGAAPNHFDGFTTVLTPDFDVTPCANYHFKLAIGDATDALMDSGVLVNIIQCSEPLTAEVTTEDADCTAGGSATATVTGGLGPFTYDWQPIGGDAATATDLPPGNYTVTIDDAIPCQEPVVVEVTIAGPEMPTVDVASQTVCNTDEVTVPDFVSVPAGATFEWSNSNTNIGLGAAGNGNIPGFTATNSTQNPITATITVVPTLGECVGDEATFEITVNPTITPQFNAVGPYCSGSAVPALPGTSVNTINGNWTPAVSNTATAEYTFTPDAGQCAISTTLTITIDPQVVPDFGAVDPYCAGSEIPDLPLVSPNGINGTWEPAINNTATTEYTFTPAITECATESALTIVINQPVDPAFTAYEPYCQESEIPALPQTSLNGIDGTWQPAINNDATTNYTFTPAVGECANETEMSIAIDLPVTPEFAELEAICQNDEVPGLASVSENQFTGTWQPALLSSDAAGNYTSTFTPDEGQCATTADLTLIVNALPVVTVNSPVVCPNTDVVLNADGAETYSWSPSAGLSADNAEEVTANVPGEQVFTVTGTDGNGCQSTAESTVSMSPPLEMSVTPDNAVICAGDEVTLTVSGATNYNWTEEGSLATSQGNTITVNLQATTTWNIDGEADGCLASMAVTVTVSEPLAPDFTAAGPFCWGTEMTELPLSSSNGISGTWEPAMNNQETTEYTFTPDAGECALGSTMTIVIDPLVQTAFAPVDPMCEGAFFEGLSSTDMNGISGSWMPSAVSNMVSGNYVFTPDAGECAIGTSVEVSVIPNPVASFSMSQTEVTLPNSSVEFTNNSSNSVGYSWTFGDNATSELENPSHSYGDHAGNYTVTLTAANELGCTDETSLTFTVREDLLVWVPNAFTPDGDEHNNMFTAKLSGNYDPYNFTMYIFDRWGTLIFETHNSEIGWDGYYKNKMVQDGVYTWKIDVKLKDKDMRKTFTGSVTKLQ